MFPQDPGTLRSGGAGGEHIIYDQESRLHRYPVAKTAGNNERVFEIFDSLIPIQCGLAFGETDPSQKRFQLKLVLLIFKHPMPLCCDLCRLIVATFAQPFSVQWDRDNQPFLILKPEIIERRQEALAEKSRQLDLPSVLVAVHHFPQHAATPVGAEGKIELEITIPAIGTSNIGRHLCRINLTAFATSGFTDRGDSISAGFAEIGELSVLVCRQWSETGFANGRVEKSTQGQFSGVHG